MKGEAEFEKITVKERERFILALIRNESTRAVIDDLRDLPSRKWKDLFAELAGGNLNKAKEKITALSPKDFKSFCAINDITPVTAGKKGGVSKAKTIPVILVKLEKLGEYLRL